MRYVNRELYQQCCDCKFAVRNRGGNPYACAVGAPTIDDNGHCSDQVFWWTKPPASRPWWQTGLLLLGATITIVPIIMWGAVKALRFAFGGLSINQDTLPLYFPRRRK